MLILAQITTMMKIEAIRSTRQRDGRGARRTDEAVEMQRGCLTRRRSPRLRLDVAETRPGCGWNGKAIGSAPFLLHPSSSAQLS